MNKILAVSFFIAMAVLALAAFAVVYAAGALMECLIGGAP